MHKIVFFVPTNDKEKVKNSLFKIGVGQVGNYDRCSFEVQGKGQFRPLKGSNPSEGLHGELSVIDEWRVEMVCPDEKIPAAVATLIESHPYETPAYEIYQILSI